MLLEQLIENACGITTLTNHLSRQVQLAGMVIRGSGPSLKNELGLRKDFPVLLEGGASID